MEPTHHPKSQVTQRQWDTLYFQDVAKNKNPLKIGVEKKNKGTRVCSVLALVGVGAGIKSLSLQVNWIIG